MDLELLARVVNTPGISGCEDAIQDVVAAEMVPVCDDVTRDRLGNVIGIKKSGHMPPGGRAIRVVLAAHADEIGAIVKHIDGDGYLRFQRVGGLYSQSLQSQLVIVHGRERVKGVIAPNFNLREGEPIPSTDDLLIDLGLPREKVAELVEPGDPITLAQELVQLNDKVILGRNFDNRIGTYCMLQAMKRVGDVQVDAYFVSSVQEEVGVRGMPVAAFAIEPDLGLAIDGSLVHAAHIKPHSVTCEMGKGTGIYLVDNLTLGDRKLIRFLCELCGREEIPFQRNIGGGTDASAIQRTGLGARTTTVGAPVRYMHSTVQLCHLDDIEATIRLLAAFIDHAHELVEDVR